MARKHPAGLEDAQQVGRQIVHLLEKALRVLVVPEIVIAWRVLIMIGKRDGCVDQVNAVRLHPFRLLHAIIIHGRKMLSLDFHSLHSYASGHRRRGILVQPILADDLAHFALQLVIPLPLLHEHAQDLLLALGADDVDDHLLGLQKSVDAMDGLYKIVEFIIDTDKDRPVAVPLEVASRTGQFLLGREQPRLALRKRDHALFTLVVVHAAVDVNRLRHGRLDCMALRFEVVPQDKVRIRVAVHDLLCLCHSDGDAVPLLPGCLGQADRRIAHQLDLPVALDLVAVAILQDVRAHVERRQRVAGIVIAEVGRLGQEQAPC